MPSYNKEDYRIPEFDKKTFGGKPSENPENWEPWGMHVPKMPIPEFQKENPSDST